jgi:hypothetical protein
MTHTNFDDDNDSPLPSQSHPPLATALFGGIGTVILGVLAVVALLGFGVFKVIQKKLNGSKIIVPPNPPLILLAPHPPADEEKLALLPRSGARVGIGTGRATAW